MAGCRSRKPRRTPSGQPIGSGWASRDPIHLLIVLTRRGEGGVSEVLMALGTDPNRVRADAKKHAFPRESPGPDVRGVSYTGLLPELDFEDL